MRSDSAAEARRARVAGFSPILGAVAGMVVWAVHFGAVYGVNAVACARGFAGRAVLGLPLVPLLVLGASALALGAVAVVGVRAWRRLHAGLSGEDGEYEPQFTVWMSAAVALLAALAIVWEAVPVLMLRPCG